MGVKEKATAFHESGFNCAQSVLGALGEYTGMDEKNAMAITGGFGGGVRCGEICGAVSGGVMALGLAFPHSDSGDAQARKKISALAGEYTAEFTKKYGCIRCQDLKHNRISCSELIEHAAELAERTILNNKK